MKELTLDERMDELAALADVASGGMRPPITTKFHGQCASATMQGAETESCFQGLGSTLDEALSALREKLIDVCALEVHMVESRARHFAKALRFDEAGFAVRLEKYRAKGAADESERGRQARMGNL